MVRGNPRQQYKEVHLASSSPEETVLMLYEGAIRFLKEAAAEISKNNITTKIHFIEKVEKIIEYLQSCLDRENGGEIAGNLHRLYEYMLVRLTEANFYNDVARLEEIAKLIGTIREGWASVCTAAKNVPKEAELQPEDHPAVVKNIMVKV